MRFGMTASLIANVILLVAKIYAYIWSHSKAVLASAGKPLVDLAPCSGGGLIQEFSTCNVSLISVLGRRSGLFCGHS